MTARHGKARTTGTSSATRATAARVAAALICLGVMSESVGQTMMLPGQFDVGPTGAALYTVPIEVPPGTGGLAPALTLDYDSEAGNGLLGVGWHLGGLPSIGRCAKTVAQDGVRGRVDFTPGDRFCMDGRRLTVISGTYGAANSEYRTEIESFAKIVAFGTAGNGPSYFTVWTKSGQIIEFGNTTDSRVLAQGKTTARSWLVNRISDTKGNYLTVSYTNDTTNGQVYPTRIDYTGNTAASVSPYNSVRFEYEARPDIIPLYIAGSMVKNTVRLKKVKTYQGASEIVKVYELAYATGSSSKRSTVTSIKVCDTTGTTCLPATNFSMTSATLGFPQTSTNPIATAQMGSSLALFVGDWNGDGITDVMTWNPSTGANKWYTNNGSLSFTITTNPIAAAQIVASTCTSCNSQLHLGDWNGDGIIDLMWHDYPSGNNRWFTNNGALGFVQTTNAIPPANFTLGQLEIADWNADGVTDVMSRSVGTGENRWFTNNGSLSFTQVNDRIDPNLLKSVPISQCCYSIVRLHVGDWNGDGIPDAMAQLPSPYVSNNRWFINDGALNFAVTINPIEISFSEKEYLGDWNGDGNTDVMIIDMSTGGNKWYVNNGALGFTLTTNPITPSTITGIWIVNVGDWNADGVSDIMFHQPSSGSNRWFVNDGKLAFAYTANPIAPAQVTGTGGVLAFGDWNGDAFADAMFRLPSNGTNRWYWKSSQVRPDLLASATTGLGSSTTVTFNPLTSYAVYTKDTDAVYPVIDIKAPFYVVRQVDAADGIGGNYRSTYAYVGAKVDVSGRGFLGFRQQLTYDLQTNIVQTLTYRQDYPFIGFVAEDEKEVFSVTLGARSNTYAATNLGGTRRYPYLAQMVEASADLNGAALPTVTSTYTYDTYGNPLTIVVTTPDGAIRTTTNTYSNNESTWILGRLLTATVTSTTPDVVPAPTGCQSNCN